MSEGKQRSSLFKFFYIVLRVLTFPIYIVIYILKNPLWFLFFILLAVGILAYYPISQGVHSSDIIEWYKNKYSEVKYDVVKTVAEKSDSGFIPEALVKEVKKEQQKLDEEKEEAKRFKGENYNAKVTRQDEFEDVANTIKKRGGFKKKTAEIQDAEIKEAEVSAADTKENIGGLSGILKKIETEKAEDVETEVVEDKSEPVSEGSLEVESEAKIEIPTSETAKTEDDEAEEIGLDLL